MGVRRGARIWFRRLAVALVLCVASVIAGAYLLLATGWGRSLGTTLINRLASTQSQTVTLGGLEQVIGGQLLLNEVALSDRDGVWAQIGNIAVTYSTSQLLLGTVQLDAVRIGAIRLHRLPRTENETAPADARQTLLPARLLPAPLRSITLAGIEIDEIAIDEQILGVRKRVSLGGNLSAQNAPLMSAADLRFTDLDNGTEIARAVWAIDTGNDDFAVKFSMAEDAGGLVAGLLAIPGHPALGVQIETTGPFSALSGRLAVDLDHQRIASGDLLLALGHDKQQVTATLKGEIASFAPDVIAPLVAGRSDLQFHVSRDGDGNIDIGRARYSSALVKLNAAGRYAPGHDNVDLDFDARMGASGEPVTLRPDQGVAVQFSDLALSGSLRGSLQRAVLQIKGAVAAASYGDAILENARLTLASDDVNLIGFSATVSARAEIGDVRPGDDNLDPLLAGGVRINTAARLADSSIDATALRIESNHFHASAKGTFNLATRRAEGVVNATIMKSATGVYRQLFADDDARLRATLASEDNRLTIKALEMESANLGARLAGWLDGDAFALNGDLTLARLSALHAKIAGQATLKLSAKGDFSNPGGRIDLSTRDLTFDGERLRNLHGEIEGSLADGVSLDVRGDFRGEEVRASAHYVQADDRTRRLSDIVVLAPASRISGALAISPDGMAMGTLDFDLSDLSQIAPLVLQEQLAGALAGSIRLHADDTGQSAQAHARAPEFHAQGIVAKGLDIHLNATDIRRNPIIDGQVSLQNVQSAEQRVENLQFAVSGGPDRFPVRISAVYDGQPAKITALVTRADEAINIVVERLAARYQSIPLALSRAASISLAGNTVALDIPELNTGAGRISATGTLGQQLDLDLDVTRMPLALIDHFAPTGQSLQGALDGQVKLTGTLENPRVSYGYTATGLSVAASREAKFAALDVTGKGAFADDSLSMSNRISGGGIGATMGGTINTKTQSLDISLDGNFPFEYFAQPLSRAGMGLTGAATLQAQATGSASTPKIRGKLVVSGAQVVDVASKLAVSDISGTADFDNERIRVPGLTGKIGSSGRLGISGQASLRPADALASDFAITVRDAIFDDGVVSAKFNAAVRLAGPLAKGGEIGGTATIAQATITIPEKFPNVVSPVEIKHKDASSAVRRQAEAFAPKPSRGTSGAGMKLAVRVDAPRRIYVRGRGLDAELGGSLTIAGTTSQPEITGIISMRRGRIDLLTRRFDFESGQVAFSGPLQPSLDFTASTRSAGHIYSIVVRGPASEPEFLFRSSPSLPQDEIIARMFFGKSLSSLSALQIAQLASAVATLSGTGSGPGMLERLRNLSGLDNIDVKTNERGETTVGVGGYLNERTYVNVEKGTSAASGKVRIDLEITDTLKARGETSADGNTKAGIFFEKDY